MSSLRAPSSRPRSTPRTAAPELRPVPSRGRSARRAPFILVFVSLLAAGMFGLLLLTTKLQDQAFELRSLQTQATELSYRQASLDVDADKARSPQALAALASALGMRANLHPVYIELPSGKIIGTPTKVKESDVPSIVVKSAEESAAEAAARAEQQATQKRAAQAQATQTTQTQATQPPASAQAQATQTAPAQPQAQTRTTQARTQPPTHSR